MSGNIEPWAIWDKITDEGFCYVHVPAGAHNESSVVRIQECDTPTHLTLNSESTL